MQFRFSSFFLVILFPFVEAKKYYVSTTGNDENVGKKKKPFKTIQHGVDQLMPGDTLFIFGGTYHEAVKMNRIQGTEDSPIKITRFKNQRVVIDGTVNIDSISDDNWTQHEGKIYKRTLNQNITQLFVDGHYQIIARWPNANTHVSFEGKSPPTLSLDEQDSHSQLS